MKKKIVHIFVIALLSILLISCQQEKIDKTKIVGKYVLESATLNDANITEEFYFYNVEIKTNNEMSVSSNYLGIIESRKSTYDLQGKYLIEKHNKNSYRYLFDEIAMTLKYEDKKDGEPLVVILKKEIDEQQDLGVDFESILFGEDISNTKKFNYAPAIIVDTDQQGKETMHIWYATNKQSGIIVDHIGYRTGVKNADDKWIFSDEQLVLAPTVGTWDARHVCDPTVIKGEFNYNAETYNYMMSYLGCVTEDYSKNETGIAIAKNPEGPWIKMDGINPIVPWSHDNNPNTSWGTGMPILISVDQKGKVLLFYSSSSIGVGVQYWDLSNLNNPQKIFTSIMNKDGAKNPNGTQLGLAIADFAYDVDNGRFYLVCRTNTKNPPDETKTLVDSHAMLAYIDNFGDMEGLLETLESGNYQWNIVDYVGPEDTGFERNHNLGLVKDSYGNVYRSDEIWAVVSTGHNSWPNENIFTYRLRGHIFDLK